MKLEVESIVFADAVVAFVAVVIGLVRLSVVAIVNRSKGWYEQGSAVRRRIGQGAP